MSSDFGGEVADFYARYRRGYDAPTIDWIADIAELDDGVAVDLGCGTGQLAIPLSLRARAVVGVDPEPRMLARAAVCAAELDRTNISWMVGSDRGLPAIAALLGESSIAAVVIGNAIHLMDHERLFAAARPLLRPGGAVVVLANGTPLWQQDSGCSRALRGALEQWFETSLVSMCGTDQASRRLYAAALAASGFTNIRESVLCEHDEELSLEYVIGHLYSAIPRAQVPTGDRRAEFEDRIRRALRPALPFIEHVEVSALAGHAPNAS